MYRAAVLALFSTIFLSATCLDTRNDSQSYSISQFLVTITGTNLTAAEVLEKLQTLIASLNGHASDINECELIVDLCNGNSSCINTLGSYICLCPPGFTLQGNSSDPCQDVNECLVNTHNCSANAECSNFPGSFSCQCQPGYFGDGFTCQDVDECYPEEEEKQCGFNAYCVNNPGSYTCICESGYLGDGQLCYDDDECLTDPCHTLAYCTNLFGSYTCECKLGFIGDGINCYDFDECSDVALNNCNDEAYCLNTEGSYVCHCKDGFEGSGNYCEDVDECKVFDFCHMYATCENHQGSFSCNCKPGFAGNGYVCQDIDECLNNMSNCLRDGTSSCSNTIGSYFCACADGFRGDGITTCTKVNKPNDCLLGTHDCDKQATCSFSGNEFTCTCNQTTYDNHTNGRECISPVMVQCTTTSITVKVIADYYMQKSIRLPDLHLNDFECGGQQTALSDEYWDFIIDDLSSCGTIVSKNQTHITYSNILSNSVKSGVYMGTLVSVPFSCSYPSNLTVALPTPYYPEANVISIAGPNGTGTFVVEMNIYTDSSYSFISNTTSFATTDILYVQTTLTADDNSLALLIHDCWATPTSSGVDPNAYYFIDNGCPIPGRVADTVHITMNGVSKISRFHTQVFGFVDYNTTYFHCTVDLCSENAGQICEKSCTDEPISIIDFGTRPKRMTGDDDVLSLGPFINKEYFTSIDTAPGSPAINPYIIIVCAFSVIIALLSAVVLYVVIKGKIARRPTTEERTDASNMNSNRNNPYLQNTGSSLPVILNDSAMEMYENEKKVFERSNSSSGSTKVEFNGV
uniref:uromodulin isoform X2 n=1 Tax=Ciona intestinalis TaxID=7719 RepID=UPI000EF51384|nr:uromodulin isoform X2 [Ciona intestinalis]|eukprot:XP_026694385.1 uromodulin isoform X2 [Ciona intestinalis]